MSGATGAGEPSEHDRTRVRELLGREPQGAYEIAVRDAAGEPVVIRNAPLLDDGTPMPTRYWLVAPDDIRVVGRLESDGGVDAAEAAVDPDELAAAHARYAAERDAALPPDHEGPRPSGGVAGTRTGVKCLHAHWAWHLAGGDDPVGRWVAHELATVTFDVHDDHTVVSALRTPAGAELAATIPWGPANLTAAWLAGQDPPAPADLTNALGAVDDHLDDVERAHPTAFEAASVRFAGAAATALARLELGVDDPPPELVLARDAAEEIFRMVATEASSDRAANPGLPLHHVPTIVATCCLVVAVMRRHHLTEVALDGRTEV